MLARVFARFRLEHERDRRFWAVTLAAVLALLMLQVASGAYRSEFTAAPDEPGHFVTALMVHDFITTLPRENPLDWAGQFFIHYPHVALGQWPPGYFILVSLWWLITGPARFTALLLQWLTGLVATVLLYRLARREMAFPAAAAMLCGVVITPVFHESISSTMADTLCFLLGVLFLGSTAAFLRGEQGSVRGMGVSFFCAALTKGTAACLLPVPILSWLASKDRRPLRWRSVALTAALAAALGTAYFLFGDASALGGIGNGMPWKAGSLVDMVGWGVLLLAAFGIKREPLPLAAASAVVSAVILSYFARAMRTDRHWIIILPAIALLAGLALDSLRPRWLLASLCLLAAALFPWRFHREVPAGYAEAVAHIPRPARMIVASNGNGEAELTAVVAGTERRPGSMVARASKVIADTERNGRKYRMLFTDAAQLERRLDELGIDAAVIHTLPGKAARPYHGLLKEAVAKSRSWQLCHSGAQIEAYCRKSPPSLPRQRMRVKARWWTFEERSATAYPDAPR